MYLPPESSVSCHLHETAGALRHPRVLTLRFRAHTKNVGVLPLPLPCSCTNVGAFPHPCVLALRSRAPAPVRKTPAPLPHTVPAPSPKTKAGRGLCPVPPFCVPISQQAAFVGAPAVGWFLDAARAFWLRPASDCWPLCQLCGPLVTGHRVGRHLPCRLLAACALLAGAGLQRTGLVLLQKLPVGS